MKQRFSVGDKVTDGMFRMVIVGVIEDDDGFVYECEATDFVAPFAREIPQEKLKAL